MTGQGRHQDEPVDASPPKAGPVRNVRRQVRQRYSGSFAERFWNRLTALDFMSKAMVLAAIAFLCFLPFILTVAALAGRDAVDGLARRLGLNHEAAHEFGLVFAPAKATSDALSGASYVLFIIGGIAFASAVEEIYEKVFDLKSRGLKNVPRRLLWLATIFVWSWIVSHAAPPVLRTTGDVVYVILAVIVSVLFWWYTPWLLLAGRVHWRQLFPVALVTGICWVGMMLVFHLVFSNSVTGNYHRYGPIGVILSLMSFFIAVGVVIMLGAVFGLVWHESRSPRTPSLAQPADDEPLHEIHGEPAKGSRQQVVADGEGEQPDRGVARR